MSLTPFKRVATAGLLVAALAGCGSAVTQVPYPNGPWPAGDQGTFIGSCESGASGAYCVCALGSVMAQYPDTQTLPGSIGVGGTTAAEHRGLFPACAGK